MGLCTQCQPLLREASLIKAKSNICFCTYSRSEAAPFSCRAKNSCGRGGRKTVRARRRGEGCEILSFLTWHSSTAMTSRCLWLPTQDSQLTGNQRLKNYWLPRNPWGQSLFLIICPLKNPLVPNPGSHRQSWLNSMCLKTNKKASVVRRLGEIDGGRIREGEGHSNQNALLYIGTCQRTNLIR